MGTMFDIVVYHASRQDAERAIDSALTEIVRLDAVMSDFKADSDLSRLNRDGHAGAVAVDPSVYAVIEQSLMFSRRSGGAFDVTIAPLLKTWRKSAAEGRRPSAGEIAQARSCVGYQRIDLVAPDRIGFRSDCLEIDLGGIGKGYAVDRAMAMLEAAGIRHALINAGTSSIAAIGAPPGRSGWPVILGVDRSAGRELLLKDSSVSTSQQDPASVFQDGGGNSQAPSPNSQRTASRSAVNALGVGGCPPLRVDGSDDTLRRGLAVAREECVRAKAEELGVAAGAIIDPARGAPAESRLSVSVVARNATMSDALSTTLVVLSVEQGRALLAQFPGVSAVWLSSTGQVHATYRESGLDLSMDN
jgi:thiamine biosynthesis lipoprotein ApbE